MARHNVTGEWGEQLARNALVAKGYAILKTNWRSGHYEVDIIAQKAGCIVFVEVKTRLDAQDDHADTNTYLTDSPVMTLTPESSTEPPSAAMEMAMKAFDARKQRRLLLAANSFLNTFKIDLRPQYDLILVTGTKSAPKVTHIEDLYINTYVRR